VVESAPDNVADTVTWTGVMLGYCATGSCDIERGRREDDQRDDGAKIGRSMKNRENMGAYWVMERSTGAPVVAAAARHADRSTSLMAA